MTQQTTINLQAEALKVMSHIKKEFEKGSGEFEAQFISYWKNGKIKRVPLPRQLQDILNSGEGKSALFGVLRDATQMAGSDLTALVFATDARMGRQTAKGFLVPVEELRGRSLDDLCSAGLMETFEALVVTAQTPDRVVIVHQFYTRKGGPEAGPLESWVGPPEIKEFPAAQFGGRQKMWNATEEDIRGFVS